MSNGKGLPFYSDPLLFEYDAEKRISKIINPTTYATNVKYINNNLIKTDYELITSTFHIFSKSNIKIENDLVKSIVTEKTSKYNNDEEIKVDSIALNYSGKSLISIYYYLLKVDGSYLLTKTLDYEYTNGNVTKMKRVQNGEEKVSVYTYDNDKYVKFSDYCYEAPFNFDPTLYPVIIEKMGTRNKNNIVKIENSFTKAPFQGDFEYINLSKHVDARGKLTDIFMSGKSISSNPDNTQVGSFENEKITLVY